MATSKKAQSKPKTGERKTTARAVKAKERPDRTPEVLDELLDRLANGEPLREICRDERMPPWRTFYTWMEGDDDLAARFARARDIGADAIAQQCMDIADEQCTMVRAEKHGSRDDGDGNTEVVFDATAVARNRLRVETRLKLLAKWHPKKYGDRVATEVSGPDGAPLQVHTTVTLVDAKPRAEDAQ